MQITSHQGEPVTTATKRHLADEYLRRPAILIFAYENIQRTPVLLRAPADLPPLPGEDLAKESLRRPRAAPSSRPLSLHSAA